MTLFRQRLLVGEPGRFRKVHFPLLWRLGFASPFGRLETRIGGEVRKRT